MHHIFPVLPYFLPRKMSNNMWIDNLIHKDYATISSHGPIRAPPAHANDDDDISSLQQEIDNIRKSGGGGFPNILYPDYVSKTQKSQPFTAPPVLRNLFVDGNFLMPLEPQLLRPKEYHHIKKMKLFPQQYAPLLVTDLPQFIDTRDLHHMFVSILPPHTVLAFDRWKTNMSRATVWVASPVALSVVAAVDGKLSIRETEAHFSTRQTLPQSVRCTFKENCQTSVGSRSQTQQVQQPCNAYY